MSQIKNLQTRQSVLFAMPSDHSNSADADILQSLYRQLVDDENVRATASQIQILEDDARTRLLVCEIDRRVLHKLL